MKVHLLLAAVLIQGASAFASSLPNCDLYSHGGSEAQINNALNALARLSPTRDCDPKLAYAYQTSKSRLEQSLKELSHSHGQNFGSSSVPWQAAVADGVSVIDDLRSSGCLNKEHMKDVSVLATSLGYLAQAIPGAATAIGVSVAVGAQLIGSLIEFFKGPEAMPIDQLATITCNLDAVSKIYALRECSKKCASEIQEANNALERCTYLNTFDTIDRLDSDLRTVPSVLDAQRPETAPRTLAAIEISNQMNNQRALIASVMEDLADAPGQPYVPAAAKSGSRFSSSSSYNSKAEAARVELLRKYMATIAAPSDPVFYDLWYLQDVSECIKTVEANPRGYMSNEACGNAGALLPSLAQLSADPAKAILALQAEYSDVMTGKKRVTNSDTRGSPQQFLQKQVRTVASEFTNAQNLSLMRNVVQRSRETGNATAIEDDRLEETLQKLTKIPSGALQKLKSAHARADVCKVLTCSMATISSLWSHKKDLGSRELDNLIEYCNEHKIVCESPAAMSCKRIFSTDPEKPCPITSHGDQGRRAEGPYERLVAETTRANQEKTFCPKIDDQVCAKPDQKITTVGAKTVEFFLGGNDSPVKSTAEGAQ